MKVTTRTKTETRRRILAAAATLFADQGYENATTRDISEAAGVATGTLFNYFASKEAIALSMILEGWTQGLAAYHRRLDLTERCELDHHLFALAASCLRGMRPHRKYLFPAMGLMVGPRQPVLVPELNHVREDHLQIVEDLLVERGLARFKSGVILQLYWSLLMGVFSFWAGDRSPKQEDTLVLLDVSTKLFLSSMTVKEET